MNGAEHHRTAERLIGIALDQFEEGEVERSMLTIAAAGVHATLSRSARADLDT